MVKNQAANAGDFETWVRSLGQEPTPVFLPGEPRGQRSLAGCSPRVELDTTERPTHMRSLNIQFLGCTSHTSDTCGFVAPVWIKQIQAVPLTVLGSPSRTVNISVLKF